MVYGEKNLGSGVTIDTTTEYKLFILLDHFPFRKIEMIRSMWKDCCED
jgi:hypothetical protein